MAPEDDNSGAATRRDAFAAMATAIAAGMIGATAARAQTRGPATFELPVPPAPRPPRADAVNTVQFQDQARAVLGPARFAPLQDNGDRSITDRITLIPRVNIPTRDLDLTCPLFGDQHFTPIIVGPIADQKRFHADGELAMVRGAAGAKAGLVVSSDSSVPLAAIAQAATTPLWVQVYGKSPKIRAVLAEAGAAKARAVVLTVNAGPSAASGAAPAAAIDWAAVDEVIKGTSLPVIVKGITRPQDAREAVARGAKGIIVSNYRGGSAAALPGTLLLIPPVVEAVSGRVPVLADGGFRYGSDVFKALGLGAKAVLIGRPAAWGLAAYGADGVQGAVELLQSDLARFAAMCGRPTLASIDPSVLKIHAPRPAGSKTNG